MNSADTEVVHSGIARALAEEIGEQRFQRWFCDSASLTVTGQTLVVGVCNAFVQEWLESQFRAPIERVARTRLGPAAKVRFQVGAAPTVPDTREPSAATVGLRPQRPAHCSPANSTPERRDARMPGEPLAALDRFVTGPCNRLAHEAALKVVEAPGRAFRPLFVYGGVGLGKSHLLRGLHAALCARHPQWRACYVTAEQFTNEFLAALRGRSLPSFRQKYRRLGALLVDDVHFLGAKKATQEEFLHTFNEIEARGGQVVLAGEHHPRLMHRVNDELTSRFQAGMVCRIDPPDYETRLAILHGISRAERNRAATREAPGAAPLTTPHSPPAADSSSLDAAMRYVAERMEANVRELRGAWNYVCAVAEVSRQPITLELARRALAEVARKPVQPVRIEDVERAVCGLFGLEPKVLKSRSRSRALARPRMLAMYLARKHTAAAYSEIGAYFGGRDHSTVISAERKVREWLDGPADPRSAWNPRECVEAIQQQLRAS